MQKNIKPMYTVTVLEGNVSHFIKATKSPDIANRVFARTARQISGFAADMHSHSKVILSSNGKKRKAVKIDTIYYK